ncbi:MAG: hypothetical protein E7161_00865 [Firmicutes bacterium]|nr:hypothetical protein [Bacillota bacterium]
MKKKKANQLVVINKYMNIIISLLIGIVIGVLFSKYTKKFDIEIEKTNEPIIKSYFQNDGQTIYLYNLNEIKFEDENFTITLNNYLENNSGDIKKTFEEILPYLKEKTVLNDGGTIIYLSNQKEPLTVIKCNTLDGNKDIYFGPGDMNTTEAFENGACGKNFFDDKKFERVYILEEIKKIKGENYSYYEVTFKDELENKTTITTKNFNENIVKKIVDAKVDNYYKITFANKYGEINKRRYQGYF